MTVFSGCLVVYCSEWRRGKWKMKFIFYFFPLTKIICTRLFQVYPIGPSTRLVIIKLMGEGVMHRACKNR